MNTTDLRATVQREYKLLARNKVNLILGLVPPAVYMLLFATSISNVIPQVTYQGQLVNYQDFIIPAIILMSMIAGATASAASLFQEELGGMLLELWSNPLRKTSYIAGKLFVTTALVLTQGLMMMIVAALVFGYKWPPDHLLMLLIGGICTSLGLNGLYLYMATLFRDQQMFMIAINVVAPLLLFSSPSFYPREQMPQLLQLVSHVNPVSYGIAALRDGLLYGFGTSWTPVLLLLILAVVTGMLTTRSLLFRFRDL